MIKGEIIKYISLCSSEQEFNKAWKRFTMALRSRGYNKRQRDKARKGIDYSSRASLIHKRIDKAAQKNVRGKVCPGMRIVVPHRPGVQERRQDVLEKDLVLKLEGGFKEQKVICLRKR